METELTLIRKMENALPMELINEILSYRPAHHLTHLVEAAFIRMTEDIYIEEEIWYELNYGTITELSTLAEGVGCFKHTIWNDVEEGNWRKYSDLVRADYHKIHLEYGNSVGFSLWAEEMEALKKFNQAKLRMNEVIAAAFLIENGLEVEPILWNIKKEKKTKAKKAKVVLVIEE
jgi:hypothetical protein